MGNQIDTVVFDLDGTLIDSQPAALRGSIEALSRFGIDVTEAEIREQFGGGSRKLMQYFLERDLSSDEAKGALDEATDLKISLQTSFTDKVVLLPNVVQLLQRLKDNQFRLALATMAARDVVDEVVSYHGIEEYFDYTVTGDDVTDPKPDPEILTKTIGLLGVSVDSTLYVGDSTHDLEAAVSLAMPFLLADTGIFVRGETRKNLRTSAESNGSPIVGINELLDICEIAKTHRF
jgi:HAD superfamily hydrolase (TIGR01549 family)